MLAGCGNEGEALEPEPTSFDDALRGAEQALATADDDPCPLMDALSSFAVAPEPTPAEEQRAVEFVMATYRAIADLVEGEGDRVDADVIRAEVDALADDVAADGATLPTPERERVGKTR